MGFWSEVRGVIGLLSVFGGGERWAPEGVFMMSALKKEVEQIFKQEFPDFEKVTDCTIAHRYGNEYMAIIKAVTKEGKEHAFKAEVQSDWSGTIAEFRQYR